MKLLSNTLLARSLFRAAALLCLTVAAQSNALAQTATLVTFSDYVKGPSGIGDINLLLPKSQAQAPNLNSYIALYNAFDTSIGKRAISFGVDINESANGTEKAETQAVAVQYAWLEVTDSSGTRNFGKAPAGTAVVTESSFYTETQALLAAKGSTSRALYPTLLGKSGSSLITGGSITNLGIFDSTLKVVIPNLITFTNVTKAVLHIRFLDTNVGLGDPEAFYDFTGGFEDIGLLTSGDSHLIDTTADVLTPRALAPTVELSSDGQNTIAAYNDDLSNTVKLDTTGFNSLLWIQKPAAGAFNLVAYEDLYPSRGDYDFNDAIIAYNYALGVNGSGEVEQISGTAYLLARGAQYSHDWSLRLPVSGISDNAIGAKTCTVERSADQNVPGIVSSSGCELTGNSSGITWKAFPDTRLLFPGTDGKNPTSDSPVNTYVGATFATGLVMRGPKATMNMTLPTFTALNKFGADDLVLFVKDTGETINLLTQDNLNFPFAMVMPTQWKWPQERIEIGSAYPTFLNFISSGGTNNLQWYNAPDAAKVVPSTGQGDWTVNQWAW